MTRAWCSADAPLDVAIRPPCAERAKAVTARSISTASRTSDRADLHSEGQRHRLDDAELGDCRRIRGITKDCHTRYIRSDLFEQLQPFPTHAVFGNHETGDVATRSRQTADDAGADWIADDRKDDRHAAGRLL